MVTLRDVTHADLPTLFEHQQDPIACEMAAFAPRDLAAFMAHWKRLLEDDSLLKRTILADGEVDGNIGSYTMREQREVGYWIGREWWGRGIATEALRQILHY